MPAEDAGGAGRRADHRGPIGRSNAMDKMPVVTKQPASVDFVVEVIKKMSPDEFRESLIRAGIIDEDGRLTENYRRKP